MTPLLASALFYASITIFLSHTVLLVYIFLSNQFKQNPNKWVLRTGEHTERQLQNIIV